MTNQEYALRFINKIKTRLHIQNKNWVCCISGETGSGKSYSAISLAKLITNEGNNIHIIFTPKEFFDIIPPNSQKLKKGDVLICDEFGVGMSSRDWQSVQNKLLGTIFQTFRVLNIAVIFTTPNLSFMDVQARKLLHCFIRTKTIDYKNQIAWVSPFNIQVNDMYDRTYFKSPKFIDEHGCQVTLKNLGILIPSKELQDYYETRKLEFTLALNRNAKQTYDGNTKKDKPLINEFNPNSFVTAILKDKDRFIREYKGRVFYDKELIRKEHKLSHSQANQVKALIENPVYTKNEGKAISSNLNINNNKKKPRRS